MHIISKNIKALRLERGWTQQEMADILFVTRQTVSNWENGKALPDIETLLQIAEKLDIDIDQLIYGNKSVKKALNRDCIRTLIVISVSTVIYMLCRAAARYLRHSTYYIISFAWVSLITLRPLIMFFTGILIIQLLKITNVIKTTRVYKHIKWYKIFLICMFGLCVISCFDIVRMDILKMMFALKIGQFKNATGFSSMDYAINIPLWLENIIYFPHFIVCSGSAFYKPPYYLIIIVLGMLYELSKPYNNKEEHINTDK